MRIGIVANSAWNIFNFRKGLIKALIANHHTIVAIAPRDEYTDKLRQMGCQFCEIKMDAKGTSPRKDARLIYCLKKSYINQRLDLVFHYTIKPNIYGTLAAKLARVAAVNNVTGLGTMFTRDNIKSKIARALYRFSFRYPKLVFFQNEDDRRLFLRKKLVDKNITDIIPGSGVDIKFFSPRPHTKNSVFVFLMVARLLYDKGIVEYINAIKVLRKKGIIAHFQVLGKIEDRKNLGIDQATISQWEREGLIEYLGKVDDVRPYVRAADCVVLPSYREGTPRALLEAASMGKPIITTDVPGCRETVINNYNGFLCAVKDAGDLAEKMIEMLTLDNRRLQQMSWNSRNYAVKKFDQHIIFLKYMKAIDYCFHTNLVDGKILAEDFLSLSVV